MKYRNVFFASEPAGTVWLDPKGNVQLNDPDEAETETPAEPLEPPIDIEALQREAYRKGFEDGKQEAIKAVQQELAVLRQNLTGLMQRIPGELSLRISQAEPQLVDLALALARKVLQEESEQSRELIKRVLKAALEQVKNQTIIAIHLNPADLQEIQPQFSDGRVELMPDANIQPGGCRIETDMGELDATLETQWEAVRKAIQALQKE
jgi:flagellar assembly protein FliH